MKRTIHHANVTGFTHKSLLAAGRFLRNICSLQAESLFSRLVSPSYSHERESIGKERLITVGCTSRHSRGNPRLKTHDIRTNTATHAPIAGRFTRRATNFKRLGSRDANCVRGDNFTAVRAPRQLRATRDGSLSGIPWYFGSNGRLISRTRIDPLDTSDVRPTPSGSKNNNGTPGAHLP